MRTSRLRLLVCAALLAGPLATLTTLTSTAGATSGDDVPTAEVPETVRLDGPARGHRAVRELGDDLDVAAGLNGMSTGELRDLLLEDPTAWVDGNGRVYFVEPPAEADAGDLPVVAAIDPADAFTLHSKPGSQRVIFLDFDGHFVSGTAWNDWDGVAATTHPAWTLDGDSASFSTSERNAIASIWARVAEDYAPFDVDVTTQDPGQPAIDRAGSGDSVYGTRVLISPSSNASSQICSGGCGGVAFLGVFDLTSSHDYYQPAWVFPQSLGQSTKSIAEAASHEAGHNFDLSHDGTASAGYYTGHAMWAPIMGVGYSKPVVQWSQGDYPGATQFQDDLQVIADNGAPRRTDEAGATVGTATSLGSATAYLTMRTDTDVWALGTCTGSVTVTAAPAAVSPNLDIEVALLNSSGGTVASANPASAYSSSDVATGLGATVSSSVSAGTYFVRVDGVGNGSFGSATGYDDYASLGAYTLASTGCAGGGGGPDPVVPGVPTSVAVTPAGDGQSATLTWSPPTSNGGSAVTGYVVQRSGAVAQQVTAATTSLAFSGLTPGSSYTFTVAAKNTVGTGTASSVSATMPVPATVPGAPQDLEVTLQPDGTSASVTWSPPASNGGSALIDYEVLVDSVPVGANGAQTQLVLTGLARGRTYGIAVRARNAIGYGSTATTDLVVPAPPPSGPPSAPRIDRAMSGKKGGKSTARAYWYPPASTGGSPVTSYVVVAYRISAGQIVGMTTSAPVGSAARSLKMKLPKGRYQFAVRARNAAGLSSLSARSATVKAR